MHYMKGYFLTNEKGKVLDVSGGADTEGRNCLFWKKHGGINQQWTVLYLDELPPEPKIGDYIPEYGLKWKVDFYLISQIASRRYMDTLSNNNVVKTPNGRVTQKFYFDYKTKTIKSKSNNYSFNIASSGNSSNMQLAGTNSQWYQIFKMDGAYIVNTRGKVVTVLGGDLEASNVGVSKRNGQATQHWKVVYCNTIKDKTSGFNSEFGF